MRAQKTAAAVRPPLQLAITEGDDAHCVDPTEVARYVGQMSAELAGLARSARLDVLAYFLDMARLEAATIDRGD